MFVYSGNTCRSPIAEGFMKSFLEERSPWMACSSGILTSGGLPASELAVSVMSEYGVDISRHRSSTVYDWDPPEGTLFFGMTGWHREELVRIFPGHSSCVFLLGEAAGFADKGNSADVQDPCGFSIASYRDIAGKIREMTLVLASSLGRDPRFNP